MDTVLIKYRNFLNQLETENHISESDFWRFIRDHYKNTYNDINKKIGQSKNPRPHKHFRIGDSNNMTQPYMIFETVIKLIKKGISIDDINIIVFKLDIIQRSYGPFIQKISDIKPNYLKYFNVLDSTSILKGYGIAKVFINSDSSIKYINELNKLYDLKIEIV